MIPRQSAVWLLVLPVGVAAWTLWVGGPTFWIGIVDAAIAIALATDWIRSGVRWEVQRHVQPVQSIGQAFPVSIRLAHGARRWIVGRVTDHAPGHTTGLPRDVGIAPRTTVCVEYLLKVASRGDHTFGDVAVRWRSPWGFWEREIRASLPVAIKVYPDLSPLRTRNLTGALGRRAGGRRVQRRRGGESEFERLRAYVQGDPYRCIDWRATARRHELVAREYRQEVDQNIIFLLESGRMASAHMGAITAFDHALNAALRLGHIALQKGDRVGLLVYDSEVRAWLPPRGGVCSAKRLTQATYDLFPALDEVDTAAAVRFLCERIRRRSLVVVLTAATDEASSSAVETLVGALAKRHLVLCGWMQVPALYGKLGSNNDLFAAGAAAELLTTRHATLRRMQRGGVLVVDADPARIAVAMVERYLLVKAERLL